MVAVAVAFDSGGSGHGVTISVGAGAASSAPLATSTAPTSTNTTMSKPTKQTTALFIQPPLNYLVEVGFSSPCRTKRSTTRTPFKSSKKAA